MHVLQISKCPLFSSGGAPSQKMPTALDLLFNLMFQYFKSHYSPPVVLFHIAVLFMNVGQDNNLLVSLPPTAALISKWHEDWIAGSHVLTSWQLVLKVGLIIEHRNEASWFSSSQSLCSWSQKLSLCSPINQTLSFSSLQKNWKCYL